MTSKLSRSGLVIGMKESTMRKKRTTTLLTPEQIEQRIVIVRGQRVMLDVDLARFYGVTTMALNQAVKRNRSSLRQTLHIS